MTQGILQPDGSKCYSGVNCKRHGTRNKVALETKEFMSAAIPKKAKFPPIIVPQTRLHHPEKGINLYDCGVSTQGDQGPAWAVETYTIWENLAVDEIEVDGVLSTLFGCPRADIPQDLFDLADTLSLADPDNYDVYAQDDYYGQTIKVELESSTNDKLLEWYWNRPEARDSQGILSYCRAKGFATAGLKPLDALKGQLAQENPGIRNPLINKATKATQEPLKLAQIVIPKEVRLSLIASAEIKPAAYYDAAIVGVVHRNAHGYSLVDGYKRFKTASSGTERYGNFFVLS